MSDLQANTYALSGGTVIPEGADMDNYKNVGNYYCSNNSITNTLINCPFKEAFTLKIEFGVGTGYPRQTFRNFNTGEIATRYFNGDSNMWGTYSYLTPTNKE